MQPARLPRAAVPRHYTWIAPVHDLLAMRVEARARRLGLAWAAVEDGEAVLEVAVGTGLSLPALLAATPSGHVVGVDVTPAMRWRARRRARQSGYTNWAIVPGDAYALPFPDAAFDVVISSYLFDLLPEADFERVLGEFGRVLRPGGRLVLVNMTLGPRWYHRLWEGLYRLAPPLLGGCRGVRVAPALAAGGFTGVRRAFVSQRTFPSEILFGRKPTGSKPLPSASV